MSANMEKSAGFVVNQGRIALVLSLITLLTLFYQGTKFILDQQFRLASLEEKAIETTATQKSLSSEISRLSATIGELNVVLREVQVRQEAR